MTTAEFAVVCERLFLDAYESCRPPRTPVRVASHFRSLAEADTSLGPVERGAILAVFPHTIATWTDIRLDAEAQRLRRYRGPR